MRLELPNRLPYQGLFLLGQRLADDGERLPPSVDDASELIETVGSIVVKAAYRLTTADETNWTMRPEDDPELWKPRLKDVINTGESFESDLAIHKPRVDIAVEQFADYDDTAELRVDGSMWLSRAKSTPSPDDELDKRDLDNHLFGYQPRHVGARADDHGNVPAPTNPPTPVALERIANYRNAALNFYRRRDDAESQEAIIATELANGQLIQIVKNGDIVFSLTLMLPTISAMVCHWCGDGPDEAPYWKRFRLGPLRADTLILEPDSQRAAVLWRGTWPWDLVPADRYRAIRITED